MILFSLQGVPSPPRVRVSCGGEPHRLHVARSLRDGGCVDFVQLAFVLGLAVKPPTAVQTSGLCISIDGMGAAFGVPRRAAFVTIVEPTLFRNEMWLRPPVTPSLGSWVRQCWPLRSAPRIRATQPQFQSAGVNAIAIQQASLGCNDCGATTIASLRSSKNPSGEFESMTDCCAASANEKGFLGNQRSRPA